MAEAQTAAWSWPRTSVPASSAHRVAAARNSPPARRRQPEGGLAAIVSALAASPDCIGGNFRLLFDGGDRFSRWLTGFYHWMRRRGLYYGDSGIFVRHDSYRAAGGIRSRAVANVRAARQTIDRRPRARPHHRPRHVPRSPWRGSPESQVVVRPVPRYIRCAPAGARPPR